MDWDLQLVVPWFAAGSSFVLLVFVLLGRTPQRAKQRLAGLAAGQGDPHSIENRARGKATGGDANVDRLKNRRRHDTDRANDLADRIVQAGIYSKNAVSVFSVIRACLCAGMVGLGLVAGYVGLMPTLPAIVVSTLAGVAATLAPSFWLDFLRHARQTQIRRAMPDALDLMGVCLQGGLSLSGALSRVSQELGTAHPLLATELSIVEREMQMGLTAGDAVRQFARRFDLEELRSLASVISQAERFGSSINKALKTYAEGLRIKRQQRAEELAQKAAVKVLFPTLFCIFPGIFVVILGPAAIRIYEVLITNNTWGG